MDQSKLNKTIIVQSEFKRNDFGLILRNGFLRFQKLMNKDFKLRSEELTKTQNELVLRRNKQIFQSAVISLKEFKMVCEERCEEIKCTLDPFTELDLLKIDHKSTQKIQNLLNKMEQLVETIECLSKNINLIEVMGHKIGFEEIKCPELIYDGYCYFVRKAICLIFQREILIRRISDINEALEKIKNSEYKLVIYIWGNELAKLKKELVKLSAQIDNVMIEIIPLIDD